jgi:hypothetical protein
MSVITPQEDEACAGDGDGDEDGEGPWPGDSAGEQGLPDVSLSRGGRAARFLTQRKVIAWGIFGLALIIYSIFLGIPYATDDLLIWITAALFCACMSDLSRWRQGLIRDWLPLYAVLAVYSLLRGYAGHLLFSAHWSPQLRFDEWIALGIAPTVRLQRAFFNPANLHVWDYAAWITYMTHFFASFIIAAVLWVKDHDRFRRFVALFVGLTFAGYITYVLYPAMPPWMVSANGYMEPLARTIPIMWNHVGIHGAAAVFEGNSTFDNDVAAVPSLHTAYPLLICLFFWGKAKPWLRVVLATYVVAMAATLVYTGEHFVFDIVLGWGYAIVTFIVGSKILNWWSARHHSKVSRPERSPAQVTPPLESPEPVGSP